MTNNLKKILQAGLILFIANSKSFSQVIELDPVTVTSSLQPVNVSKTGRNIVVIRGEQFSNLPVHSIDELLRYLPGIEVQVRGAMGSQSDIVLRGGTFQQVLIILDGARLNDPNTGHFNSYIPIAPSEIDRVEILKGASSAIYGSEAVGGVIHIITKTFATRSNHPDSNREKKQLGISGAAGEYSLINASAGGFFQKNKTAIDGGLLTNNSDGQPQRGARGFFNNQTASVSINQYFSGNWNASFRTSYDDRKFGAQNFYTSFVSDTAEEQVKTFWNQARIAYNKDNNKLSVDVGYKQVKDKYAFNSAGIPNRNTSRLFQGTLQFDHTFGNNTSLVTGAQYQDKAIRSNDRGNHNLHQLAGFAILNQTIGSHFYLSPAIRIDWHENAGTEFVPQINLSYRKNSFQLRGSAGKTIRQADFTERYNNYNKIFVAGGNIGNPDLQAERSFSYEAGADFFAKSFLKISSTFFRREQKNVIDWTPTPYSQMPRKDNLSPTGNYALATNIAEVNTNGFETDIQFIHALGKTQQLWSTLGLTWLDSKTSETIPSFYISSHAKFLANLSMRYSNKYFALGTTAIFKHRRPQEATAIKVTIDENCFMLNGEAEFFLLKNKLSCFVEVDDIFNETCRDLLGSQKPGRWALAGIKLNFQK